jgi:hypothetical protein
MQFPWGCGSYKSNYSEFITSKYSSATEYMSIEQEKAFTIAALDIIIKADKKNNQFGQQKAM